MPVASVYENGGIIGQTLDLGSTEQYITGSSTPSLVGTASASGSSTLDLTGITGLSAGDLVILFATDDAGWGRSVTSTGWTEVANFDSNSVRGIIYYKVMVEGDVDDGVGISDFVDAITATAWRGVDYESISSITVGGSNTTTIDPASVTVTNDNSVVLVMAAIDDDNSTISSPPTGYTTAVQNGRAGGSNAQLYKTSVSAGTEDPSSLTWSSPDALISYTLVLSPQVTYGNKKNSGIWNLDAITGFLSNIIPASIDSNSGTSLQSTANSQTYSFTANLTYSAGDNLVVFIAGRAANDQWPDNQITIEIDGVECDLVGNSTGDNAGFFDPYASCASTEATSSGTSFGVSINISSGTGDQGANCSCLALVVKGTLENSYTQSHVEAAGSSGISAATYPNGYVIAMGTTFDANNTETFTWTGITSRGEFAYQENNTPVYAWDATTSSGTTTIKMTNSSGSAGAICVLSFSEKKPSYA